jgi:hypothetical protein
MANTSKKQGAKRKSTSSKSKAATKKSGSKSSASSKKTSPKKASKSTKKPASFSKKATSKNTTKKRVATKKVKTETKKTTDFSEFEAFKINQKDNFDSKIIIRDVERETPVETKPAKVKEEPITIPAPKPTNHQPKAPTKTSAKELKEQEIAKAIKAATKLPTSESPRRRRHAFGEFGWKRAILVATCITTAIFAVAYFVNLTSSNMSLQVAASQSGIDAKYPSYVPRGYELSEVTSSSGKVSIHFKSSDGEFGLSEESSAWDSEALLNNYIKPKYDIEYTVIREQGLTLYIGPTWAAWVNGGMLYKIDITSGSLTKKQMKSIATSL